MSRRKFLKQSSLAIPAFTILPRHVLGGKNFIAPSDKVNVAVVGVGGRGRKNIIELLKLPEVQITSIADPAAYWDLSNFYYKSQAGREPIKAFIEEHNAKQSPNHKVSTYVDFREMLAKESDIDAVLCATPDHTHAYVSIHAMNAGKHVYCEKPLTHNIWEARKVARVAKETGLATQMGNQQHSSANLRKTVEYLKTGVLGKIKEVHAWVPATRWIPELKDLPSEKMAVPKGMDWDKWIGPRAYRGFHDNYAPVTWRDFWEYGCGAMGDFGCHDLDAPVWGLDLKLPTSVEMHPAGFSNGDIVPFGEIGYFEFPSNDGQGSIKVNWYAGGLKPSLPELVPAGTMLPRRGALYVGDRGILVYGDGESKLYPESLAEDIESKLTKLAPTNGHHADWIAAIKGGPVASSNFAYGAHLTEITLLGVLSLRLGGKKIYWDAEQMKAIGLPEADSIIEEPIRSGWEM